MNTKLLTIAGPNLKHRKVNFDYPQNVDYIAIPDNITAEDLNNDITQGAVHLKGITNITCKKKAPKYIVVTAYDKADALLGITYIASILKPSFDEKNSIYVYEDITEDDEYLCDINSDAIDEFGLTSCWDEEETYITNYSNIPLITSTEVLEYFEPSSSFDFNFSGFSAQGQQSNTRDIPFWAKRDLAPICIILEDSWSHSTEENERFVKSLNNFSSNYLVFLVNIITRRFNEDNVEDQSRYSGDYSRTVINDIFMTYAADEVVIKKTDLVSKYYEMVFKTILDNNSARVGKRFNFKKTLENMRPLVKADGYSALIENVVKYALKDKVIVNSNDRLLLKNKDFDFIEKFTGKKYYKEDSLNSETSAKHKLLNELVGMDKIKEQVLNIIDVMKFNEIRRSRNINGGNFHNVHVMLGAPGTAKTTIAKLMGKIMYEEGLLEDDRTICINGAQLKGEYVGQTAPKIVELFESNDIIIIDEAYSLVSEDGFPDSYSNEAIAQLVIEIESHCDDKLVIFAGYGGLDVTDRNNRMNKFIDANPGIKSRINTTFYFESYTPEQMQIIFAKQAELYNYDLEDGYEDLIIEYFTNRVNDENFGNGREARSLLEACTVQTAKRVMNNVTNKQKHLIPIKDLKVITLNDIKTAISQQTISNSIQTGKQANKIGFGVR